MKEFKIDYAPEWADGNGDYPVRVVSFENESVKVRLQKRDLIVATVNDIKIIFDYPLDKSVELEFSKEGGWTTLDFWEAIYNGYKQIYGEEDEAAGETGYISGMCNRARSDGPYGICGHHIGDLFIEGVEEVESNKYRLIMGS